MEEGARVLGDAGQWIRALAFARRTLGNGVATNIFQPEADRLKDSGWFYAKIDKSEKLCLHTYIYFLI